MVAALSAVLPENPLHRCRGAHRGDVLDERHRRDEEERRAERLQRLEEQHRLGDLEEGVARQPDRVQAEGENYHKMVPEVLYHKPVRLEKYLIIDAE